MNGSFSNPPLASDWFGRVGFDTSNGNLENYYNNLVSEQAALNAHLEEREDSAVQRWANDVRQAGLNPAMFTGSGASSSQVTAPHKSALEGLLQTLTVHNKVIGDTNEDIKKAILTGIKTAIPFLALFGL